MLASAPAPPPPPDGLQVGVAVSETARNVTNVRIGVVPGMNGTAESNIRVCRRRRLPMGNRQFQWQMKSTPRDGLI